MKNLFLLALIFVFAIGCESGKEKKQKKEETNVPAAILTNFQQIYPNEKSPDWSIDKNGWYEARFKVDGEKYRADFRPTGEWIETENDIKQKNLPKVIKDIIDEQFQDYKVVEVERVTHHKKGLFYDVEFEKDGEKMDVEFNEKGEAIGMEKKKK